MAEVIYFDISYDDMDTYNVKEVSSGQEANAVSATDLSSFRDARPQEQEGYLNGERTIGDVQYHYRLSTNTYELDVNITYNHSNGGAYQIGPFYGNLKDGLSVNYEGKGNTKFFLKNRNELWISTDERQMKLMSF